MLAPRGPKSTKQVGSVSEKGERNENQDVSMSFQVVPGVIVTSVFDGHGASGKACAESTCELINSGLRGAIAESFGAKVLQTLSGLRLCR